MVRARLEHEKKEDYTLLYLAGSWLDIEQKGLLLNQMEILLSHGEQRFIADFRQLSTLNSEGINELIRSLTLCKESGGQVRFIHVSERVKELLDIIQLNQVMGICASEQEAAEQITNSSTAS